MQILGIETSCDETAAAVVEDGYKLLSNVVASSVDLHAAFGGVVPEIAARSHIESILPVIDQALTDAFAAKSSKLKAQSKEKKLSAGFDPWDQIDAIAVTQGPGLIGSLLIGVLTARTLAIAKNKPLYAINHVQAHVFAPFLTEASPFLSTLYTLPPTPPTFPLLALIVSGGHTQLVLFKSPVSFKLLGQTTDDAVGEAYDKVAKMLGLPYPGGPSIDKAAQKGDPKAIKLPYAKLENPYDFSFSGLKTAVLRAAQKLSGHDYTFPSGDLPDTLTQIQKVDIAASFQHTAVQTLVDNLKKAYEQYQPPSVVIAGGVAANQELRKQASRQLPTPVIYPDIRLCTDNAAMVATLGYFQAKDDQKSTDPYSLEAQPGLSM
ncbi:MAG: tRNA (adenosine(37)-N6)-threonylcarbamoyltransferase complex transferase subunit TsaD [Patescibacteria group bacterium]